MAFKGIKLIDPPNPPFVVYRLNFGPYYYIGKSTDLIQRILKHKAEIEYTVRMGKSRMKTPFYGDLAKVLVENPSIEFATVEILHSFDSEAPLSNYEEMRLVNSYRDKKCLNPYKGPWQLLRDLEYLRRKQYDKVDSSMRLGNVRGKEWSEQEGKWILV